MIENRKDMSRLLAIHKKKSSSLSICFISSSSLSFKNSNHHMKKYVSIQQQSHQHVIQQQKQQQQCPHRSTSYIKQRRSWLLTKKNNNDVILSSSSSIDSESAQQLIQKTSISEQTAPNYYNKNVTFDMLMDMDIILYELQTNPGNYIIGAIQDDGTISPLSSYTIEYAYLDMIAFVVDELDRYPGITIEDITNNIKLFNETYISYSSRQLYGGKGPGNPHGEESEILYYISKSAIPTNVMIPMKFTFRYCMVNKTLEMKDDKQQRRIRNKEK